MVKSYAEPEWWKKKHHEKVGKLTQREIITKPWTLLGINRFQWRKLHPDIRRQEINGLFKKMKQQIKVSLKPVLINKIKKI